MRVVLNKQEGSFDVKGSIVSFTAADAPVDGEATERFTASEVTQLLRSRKDATVAKMVTEAGRTYIAQFSSLADREAFVEAVVQAQAARRGDDVAAKPSTADGETAEQWVSRAICQAAVDVGALSRTELQDILNEENRRGVVQAFDALEALVDRSTFRLKPLTESMENDVLRQVPILAVIFERYVMDEETKRSFWEAVVRKYFCFSRTFLEEELERVEVEAAQANEAAPSRSSTKQSNDAEAEELSTINRSSWRALPKLTEGTAALVAAAQAGEDEDSEEARAVRESEAVEAGEEVRRQDRFVPYFRPKRTLCVLAPDLDAPAPPIRRVRVEEPAAGSFFTGRSVATTLPTEPTHKDVLEVLRRFWRSSNTKQRETILAEYDKGRAGGPRRESFIEATCLQQARDSLRPGG